MEYNISILQYIKRKYHIEYLEEMIALFYLSLLASIIIYLSMKFEVIQMTFIIFIILFVCIFVMNQFYKKKYDDKLEIISEKMKAIKELLNDLAS